MVMITSCGTDVCIASANAIFDHDACRKVDDTTAVRLLMLCEAEKLTRGVVVEIPTGTVYGLAADPFNLAAVDEIYRVKGRPEARALPILVNSVDMAFFFQAEDGIRDVAVTGVQTCALPI